jgi:hypothetical protein
MNIILIIIAILIPLFIAGIYLLRYLDGYYTITSSEILKEGNITSKGTVIGQYYIIKTTYSNNRIKITKSEHI